ncbi:MAG: HD domain-containing protein [Candidatus Woesearchaeota archaeon]
MNKEDIIFFHSWFDNYVRPFCSVEGDIRTNMLQKLSHTKRVCSVMVELGTRLGFDEQKMFIAEAIALFHDVGRFEQLRKYKTYNDADSEDHALLSVKVLEREGVLECLSSQERRWVTAAVRHHNAYELPDYMADDCLFFSKLIRDADKLDIVDVELDYYHRRSELPNAAMEMGLPDDGTYSADLIRDILSCNCIKYGALRTYDDMKLLLLAWVFDLNFSESLKIFSERDYVDKIFGFLPNNADIAGLRSHMMSFIGDSASQKL